MFCMDFWMIALARSAVNFLRMPTTHPRHKSQRNKFFDRK